MRFLEKNCLDVEGRARAFLSSKAIPSVAISSGGRCTLQAKNCASCSIVKWEEMRLCLWWRLERSRVRSDRRQGSYSLSGEGNETPLTKDQDKVVPEVGLGIVDRVLGTGGRMLDEYL